MSFGAECFLRCDLQGFKGRIKQTYPEPYEVLLETTSLVWICRQEESHQLNFADFPV